MILNFKNFICENNYIDVYNIAVKYLNSKYGVKGGLTSKIQKQLSKARNKKERDEIMSKVTDSDYFYYLSDSRIEDINDKELYLLIKQYNISSTTIRPELYNKLVQMKIIKK